MKESIKGKELNHQWQGEFLSTEGQSIRYAYHYNLNALNDARIAGSGIVALTASGNLVRFDRLTWKPTAQRFEPSRAVRLGGGGKEPVLAAFEDGRVCQVDGETLDTHLLTRVEGTVKWMDVRTSKKTGKPLYLVVESNERSIWRCKEYFRRFRASEISEMPVEKATCRLHMLPGGRTIPLLNPGLPGAYLWDRHGHLWLGYDNGEFGGACGFVDLASGHWRRVGKTHNVSGFLELKDGCILEFGGLNHFYHSGYIAEVGKGQWKMSWESKTDLDEIAKPAPKSPLYPRYPIDLMRRDSASGQMWVFSGQDIFSWDMTRNKFEYRYTIDLPVIPRAASVGWGITIRATLPRPDRGPGIICATLSRGLLELDPEQWRSHEVPNQLDLSDGEEVGRIESVHGGLFLFLNSFVQAGRTLWYEGDRWSTLSLLPEEKPATPYECEGQMYEDPDAFWMYVDPAITLDGSLIIMAWNNSSPGKRLLFQRRDGKDHILWRVEGNAEISSPVTLPDGQIWGVGVDKVFRLAGGEWDCLCSLPTHDDERYNNGYPCFFRTVNPEGPPWLVFQSDQLRLLRFQNEGKPATMSSRQVSLAGKHSKSLDVLDAMPWSATEILVVTPEGLKRYDIAADHAVDLPGSPPEGLQAACRDGLGRIWAVGDHLWLSKDEGKTFQKLDALPMVGPSLYKTFAPDPVHPDGVVLSLCDRGVLFVRAEEAR